MVEVLRNYPHPWLKLPFKSGQQRAAMGNFWGITPWLNLPCKSWLQCEDFWAVTPLTKKIACKSGLQWEDLWGITPLTKIAIFEWAAMGWILRNYPTPLLKMPSKCGLQWAATGNFWGITPWLKMPCKSGLQCVAMGGFLSNYPLTKTAK